ncbi:MAG: hypothetical protein J7J67_01930 [Thermoproteales archaeon]|nr:hypothetical protein [Thermoproteales archaeon]
MLHYDRDYVLEKVRWAKDYWLMRRQPIPTKRPNKCRTCVYRSKCPYSLAKS